MLRNACPECVKLSAGDCGAHGIQMSFTPNPGDPHISDEWITTPLVVGVDTSPALGPNWTSETTEEEEAYVPLSKVSAAMLLAGIEDAKQGRVTKLLLDSLAPDEDEDGDEWDGTGDAPWDLVNKHFGKIRR